MSKIDGHNFFVEDQYMCGGLYTSCECGWKGEVCSYRWIREHYSNYDGLTNLGEGFLEFLYKEWEAHLKDIDGNTLHRQSK